jgi:hypothetical protein
VIIILFTFLGDQQSRIAMLVYYALLVDYNIVFLLHSILQIYDKSQRAVVLSMSELIQIVIFYKGRTITLEF